MKRRVLISAVPALLASACTSVPLTTLWKLRSFSMDDFLAMNPSDLRGAVRTDTRASFSSVDISFLLTPKSGEPSDHSIRLQQGVATDARLEAAPADRRWYVFALGTEGVKVFDTVRKEISVARKAPGGSLRIGIAAQEANVPPDLAKALPLRVDLLLDPKQGWFTMVSETRVDTTRPHKS